MSTPVDKVTTLPTSDSGWIQGMPAVFVLIWSTGFIVAKFGLPFASPLWFLNLRFAGVLLVLLLAMPFVEVPWPSWRTTRHIALAGLLLQAGYAYEQATQARVTPDYAPTVKVDLGPRILK